MTTRAKLHELGLAKLRAMASEVDVEHEGLQKSKLIAAIMESEKFDPSMLPETADESPNGEPGADAAEEGASAEGEEKTETAADGEAEAKPRQQGDRQQGDRQQGDRQQGDRQQGGGQQGARRRRRGRGRGPQEPIDESELEVREGILDILPEGYGFLRCTGYLPGEKDVYVSANHVRKNRLRKGDICTGPVRPARAQEKFPALVRVVTVNGIDPEEAKKRVRFADLTPLFPDERLRLEVDGQANHILPRIVDIIAPIGKGQRGLIVSPPKAGKTTVLKEIANSITANNPECHLMVVLVDERPEEVTDMQRSVKG